MNGPAIFLAQFLRDTSPYNRIDTLAPWAAGLGYTGLQIPAWDQRVVDLDLAAGSKAYCDDYRGALDRHGWVTELTPPSRPGVGHAPVYAGLFQPFYRRPEGSAIAEWATDQLQPSPRRVIWVRE
jgi:hypothetical protein